MDYVARLSSLLRERELAQRKMPDARWLEGPDKGRFWNRILSRFTPSEQRATKDRWAGHLLDVFSPGPQTEDEQRISDQNRTIREIDADIAAIPEVTVTRRDHTPTDLPPIAGRAIVMAGLAKELKPYARGSAFSKKHVIERRYHPAIWDGLAETLGSCRADCKTRLSIHENGRRYPFRSHANFFEEQNHDSAVRVDVDGRHYCLDLALSKPLFAALLKCLPSPKGPRRHSSWTRHVLYAPIAYDDTPRDIPYGDPTPNIRYPSVRLTQLLVAQMSSVEPDAKLEKVISLTESD
ncbi:hypothetical protein EYC08_19990 [Tabrizicola sp. WMC-M-20]|nr:hypothetical protein EYC08_19990 [Tabrizicola sp. WMC-M-20]